MPANPPASRGVYAEAITYAESRRSMIIVDIPINVVTIDQMQTWIAENDSLRHPNSAVYYPRTFTPDPLNQSRQRSLASSGTIGGLWARTDTARGVWKAPAGTDARLRNVESLTYVMTDLENGTLNPLGRQLPDGTSRSTATSAGVPGRWTARTRSPPTGSTCRCDG